MEIVEKDLQVQIVNVKSEIEKSKDVVDGLKDLGEFLLGLSPPTWVSETQAKHKQQMEQFKRQWIKEHKEDTKHDHIIFRTDDPVIFSEKSPLLSP